MDQESVFDQNSDLHLQYVRGRSEELQAQSKLVRDYLQNFGMQTQQSTNPLKSLVSKQKNRFVMDGFDLDLTYITEQIIAMGFPAIDYEAIYRNSMNDVQRFFNQRHKNHYRIINLCSERKYDHSYFDGNVSEYPFDDHQAPPFTMIYQLCNEIHNFITNDKQNVVAIHCKAGKGRTGVMICCYLLYSGIFKSSFEAMRYYGMMRTKNNKGVTIPSQIRYVLNFEKAILNEFTIDELEQQIQMVQIRLIDVPSKCNPFIIVYNGQQQYTYINYRIVNDSFIIFPVDAIVSQDIRVICYNKTLMGKEVLFQFWFHSAFSSKRQKTQNYVTTFQSGIINYNQFIIKKIMKSVQSARLHSSPFLHKKKSTEITEPLVKVQSPSGSNAHPAFGRCPTVKTLNSERDPVELTISLMIEKQKIIVPINIHLTTTDLFKKLISRVMQTHSNLAYKIKHFQTHSSVKNYNIDYYLSLERQPLEVFMEMRHLKLEPYLSKPTKQQLAIDDFDILKCIGVGGFSRVYLVRKKDSGQFYAMKLIDKNFILTSSKEIIINNERQVMEELNSPYLAKLFYSFESKYYLVFVMEYCAGGELFYHLRKLRRLNEQLAKQYFVQVCLAIDELHKYKIVYRDIKPENILLDLDGYIRLSDFGLAKPNMGRSETAYSFCGSPEYMSPEMLRRDGHNFMVDIYCLGALLYEFVCGSPPFYSRNVDQIYKSILYDRIQFPPNLQIGAELKDLIQQLLVKDPIKRLGAQNGIRDILKHKWFKGFDVTALEKRKLNISYKPFPLKYNFDEVEFSKGDLEFQAKLIENMQQEKSKFTKYFPNFDYLNHKILDTRQIILDQLFKQQQIQTQGQQGLPKQKTQICLSPVSQIKGDSNIRSLLQSSFKSQCKRFNTDIDAAKLIM